ncbi:hypothetical protein BBF96_03465 [Anoxybacter fermentans]|uniref:Phage head morphogenesis domain-containing protein n=1 Tax=Anoxybacter fermentans TaxID=1323375 RepID=A0A3S9SW53_9FIRM|nr:minor capsid protein [Anoxybacter fermentans]AZR72521.1 hypothetical protein BBF96_03465 [Anoxybacter fermentans]
MLLRKIQQRVNEESLARKYLQELERLIRDIEKRLKLLEQQAAKKGKWKRSWWHEAERLLEFKQALIQEYEANKRVLKALDNATTPEELIQTLVNAEFNQYNRRLIKKLTEDLVEIYINETEWTRKFLQNYVGGRVKFEFSRQINQQVVTQLIKGATINGKTLKEYLSRYSRDSAEIAENIIKNGIALGESVHSTVKQLQSELTDIAKWRLETTVRTWTIKTHTDANIDTYREAGIKRVQWCSALDMRVCPRCAVLDGKVFILSRLKKKPPLHPNCRCCLLPIVDENDIFDSAEEGYKAWLAEDKRSPEDLLEIRSRVLREKSIKPEEKKVLLRIIDDSLKKKGYLK